MTLLDKSRLSIIIGCFLILLTGSYFFYKANSEHSLVWSLVKTCAERKNNSVSCVEKAILDQIEITPNKTDRIFSGLMKLIRSGELNIDARNFSDLAHKAGMELINDGNSLKDAVNWCGLEFKQACIHGTIMTYIDTYNPKPINSESFSFCSQFRSWLDRGDIRYLNCIHALGHEVIAHKNQSLVDALGVCERLTYPTDSACASGIWMEYSKGEPGLGHHSEAPIGTVVLSCTNIDNRWQSVCYSSTGSYGQYYPDQESWNHTLSYCISAEPQYQSGCMAAVFERLQLSVAYSKKMAKSICNTLSEAFKQTCLDSL